MGNTHNVNKLGRLLDIDLKATAQSFQQDSFDANEILGTLGKTTAASMACGLAAAPATTALIGLFGTASTGTAISSLSGAAATNATLAFLGGGSLAAGGGGMALGATVLGGITAAAFVLPAALIGSSVYAKKGEEMLTQATKYAAKVDVQIEKMKDAMSTMGDVSKQIKETQSVVGRLDKRANQEIEGVLNLLDRGLLHLLDRGPFTRENKNDLKDHYHTAYQICKAINKILNTPITNKDGSLNQESVRITIEYSERYL